MDLSGAEVLVMCEGFNIISLGLKVTLRYFLKSKNIHRPNAKFDDSMDGQFLEIQLVRCETSGIYCNKLVLVS